jgi:hypothetical protein
MRSEPNMPGFPYVHQSVRETIRSAPEGTGSRKRLPCFSQIVVCDHRASPTPSENDTCGLRSLRAGGRLDISQDMCCACRVVKGTEPILELGDRSDVGSSTAEKKTEEFRRVANILECYSGAPRKLASLEQTVSLMDH